MLSSCLTPQYNVCSFVVLKHPPYLMVPVTVTTYWYDNYDLAVLHKLLLLLLLLLWQQSLTQQV